MAGSLYVVSTPIGNLDDITFRAVNTLKSVGLIAAEDTRRTDHLLKHFGLTTPTTSLHEHNENQKIPQLLRTLANGTDIALVSDAGTPVVADPGQRLIARAIAQGVRIVPIPGASAVLSALAASGYPADEFVFAGFAPAKSSDRKKWLSRLADESRTVIFFEAPHRIGKTVGEMREIFGKRPITVARELTKLHEHIVRTTADQLDEGSIPDRGEFTVVLAPFQTQDSSQQHIDNTELMSYFGRMIENGTVSRRQAVSATADKFGLTTNEVYARLERIKSEAPS